MAKSFLVSPGRAYLVIAGEGTKIVRTNGSLIDTVPEGANNVSITVDTHEIIVMDNAAKIQQLYNGNSGSSGIMTTAEGEDAGSWKVEIVSSLPEQGSAGIIYMLRTNRTGTDRYDDYIWIPEDNAYELLGRRPESTSVDLSNVAKTDAANTFTKSQQINGTLTATSIDATRLSCEQQADIGTADVSYLNYDTAGGSCMTVSHVTILTSLHVAPQAAIDLPGLEWRDNLEGGRFISASYDVGLNTLTVTSTAHVSNVLTLGTGNIELDGYYGTIKVQGADASVVVDPSRMQILATDARMTLTGSEITMNIGPDSPDSRTVFSVTQDAAGKFILNVSDGATLGGSVSIPDTLTVHNLNVTGTVTGITTGGGDTPTIDFSNGVTIMETLTADDVIADTVSASTLSAGSSLSVASESVIYKHSDGAIYIHGDIVNVTQVAATTFIPTNIQGATFTGPLVMSKDNSLLVWNQGNTAEIRNGNITGFYYAQVDHCSVTHALSADSAKINRASVTDTLVVKDLVVTGTTTGIPTGGGGSVEIPDPLSVNDLSANVAAFGAVTVSNTLTVPSGVYFAPSLAFRKKGDLQKVQLENPNNENDNIVLGVHRVECTAMDVTDLTVHGSIKGLGANTHASEVWCLKLGSDHEHQSNPIEVLSPLDGRDMLLRNSLTILPEATNVVYDGTNVSGCIELGMDGYHTYPNARFAVGQFTVATNPRDGVSSPILAILNTRSNTSINGVSTSIQKFKVAIAPAYGSDYDTTTPGLDSWQTAMLELTGDNAWKLGGTSQFALTARVDTLKIFPRYTDDSSNSPMLTLGDSWKDGSSHMVSLVGALAHYTGNSPFYTSYYMDTKAAYYCGTYSQADRPALYINPNRDPYSNVRALYSYHTNEAQSASPTAIAGLYSRTTLCAATLTAGTEGQYCTPMLSQLGVNMWGTYIQKPIRALDSTSDIKGLYYKPTTTILPNLWQELVTSNGRPLSSVSEYTLDETAFRLLSNTAQHPTTTSSFPSTISAGHEAWEAADSKYDICVTSIEFGFSTGANGLTLTWPSQLIWPDEPDRLPPTQFQPNMCYRFVARMEPIPDPNANMFDDASIAYKWVILVSQTYSYPNPWATT